MPSTPPLVPSKGLSAFRVFLQEQGLLPRTIRAYVYVVQRVRAYDTPGSYLKELVRRRSPEGTVLQARAATVHWCRFMGMDEAAIQAQIPRAKGRKSAPKQALTEKALACYTAWAAEQARPLGGLLRLLPVTGLRVTEACRLRVSDVQERDGLHHLALRGKGDKPRVIPLGPLGSAEIAASIAFAAGRASARPADALPLLRDTYLFSLRGGRPPSASAVRAKLNLAVSCHPHTLKGLTPHVLRHTYATRAVTGGVDVARLQAILGHADIATTQRYLHFGADDLAQAIEGVAGL